MSVFKDCDIRGEYGSQLTLDHANRLGYAIAHLRENCEIIVGGDGRVSTPELKNQLIKTLVSIGCSVIDIGQVPTPVFYYARETLGIKNGVMVTASHNPPGDNGFKFILGELPITPDEMRAVKELAEHGPAIEPNTKAGTVNKVDILPPYFESMKEHTPDLAGMRVVVDCSNGMACLTAPALWRSSGAQTHLLFAEVDGHFSGHPPNPAKVENLSDLIKGVREHGADLGIAYDGDGDRVFFVDRSGTPLSADQAIVIYVHEALKTKPGPIVYDQKCSRIVREAILELGGEPIMERSGHTFIKTTFLTRGAPYAGELSGHHFFEQVQGDDALYASLKMAEVIKETGTGLADIASGIPTYASTPDIRLPMNEETIQRVIEDLKEVLVEDAQLVLIDGVRAEFPHGWGLARPSVTEPVITMRFEGINQRALLEIVERFESSSPTLRGRILPHVKT